MGLQIPGESFYWVSRSHRFRVPWLLRHVEPPWAALPAPSNTNPPSFLLSSNPPKRIHLESASQSWHLSVNPKSWQTLSYHQFSSIVQLCPTLCDPCTAACQASLSITNSQSLLKLTSIKLVMPSNYLILRHPLLLLPSIFPSIRILSNESVLCNR